MGGIEEKGCVGPGSDSGLEGDGEDEVFGFGHDCFEVEGVCSCDENGRDLDVVSVTVVFHNDCWVKGRGIVIDDG